jgi:hypothetical protein
MQCFDPTPIPICACACRSAGPIGKTIAGTDNNRHLAVTEWRILAEGMSLSTVLIIQLNF